MEREPESAPPRRPMATALSMPHRIYALISLCFGVALALITPPNATPDESAHVARAVTLAQGILMETLPGEHYPDFHAFYGGLETEIFQRDTPLTAARIRSVAGRPLDCRLSADRQL